MSCSGFFTLHSSHQELITQTALFHVKNYGFILYKANIAVCKSSAGDKPGEINLYAGEEAMLLSGSRRQHTLINRFSPLNVMGSSRDNTRNPALFSSSIRHNLL